MRAKSHLLTLLASIAMALVAATLAGHSQTADSNRRDNSRGVERLVPPTTTTDPRKKLQELNQKAQKAQKQAPAPLTPKTRVPLDDKFFQAITVAPSPQLFMGNGVKVDIPLMGGGGPVNLTPATPGDDPAQLRRRFIGGTLPAAAPGLRPRMVDSVAVPNSDIAVKIDFKTKEGVSDRCTGVVLNRGFVEFGQVLTAGHCSCGELSSYEFSFVGPTGENVPAVLVSLPVRYADYSCRLNAEDQIGRDLALFLVRKANQEQRAEETPPPLVIATMHQVFDHTGTERLVGIGYGSTETVERPDSAQAAFLPIASFFCTSGIVKASPCASFREFVLADLTAPSGANRPDSCGGDSGAPIYWIPALAGRREIGANVLDAGPHFLVGITSRALAGVQHNPGTRCGGGGVYTAIGHPDVLRWLAANNVTMATGYLSATAGQGR